jgi:hypothetical protein
MTRAEIADALESAPSVPRSQAEIEEAQVVRDAAADELRKTCAGCQHFGGAVATTGYCNREWSIKVPLDGSGYCSHGWRGVGDEV